MHESALASAIVSAVSETLSREGSRVKLVRILIGELQNLDPVVLREFVEMGFRDAGISVSYEIVEEEAVFKCRRCGLEWKMRDSSVEADVREFIHFLPEAAYAFLKCPSCSSSDFEITRGRGVSLAIVVGD